MWRAAAALLLLALRACSAAAVTTSQASCTTTSGVVLSPPYQAFTLVNQAATDLYWCYGPTCTTGTGIRLQQNMTFTDTQQGQSVSCITAAGTATLGLIVY